MALFICGDLYMLLKSLMKRFVKPAVMKDITSAVKMASVAVSSLKNDSLLEYSKIDIGFEAETAVTQAFQEKKAKDKDILEFRLDCHKWLTTTVCLWRDGKADLVGSMYIKCFTAGTQLLLVFLSGRIVIVYL